MDLGFETIGNATLVCHDAGPVLVTDPWIVGSAYYGSWSLSHEIPEQQMGSILGARYVWLSHGHPDHLSLESLELLKDKRILLPDHAGARIRDELLRRGFQVQVLSDRVWTSLTPRLRVMCIPDFNQDAVLVIDLGGRLLVNLNDASDRGWGRFVRGIVDGYDESFLLAYPGDTEADLIHFRTDEGRSSRPPSQIELPGRTLARKAGMFGARFAIPLGASHRYQRSDSRVMSGKRGAGLDPSEGFTSDTCELLPTFLRFDLSRGWLDRLSPAPTSPDEEPLPPSQFGDDWSASLEKDEVAALGGYFQSMRHLERIVDFLRFRVGGKEHRIAFHAGLHGRGISFEAPRNSLMAAVREESFGTLLLGNFVKTTLHGAWEPGGFQRGFVPWVARYAETGRARAPNELRAYFSGYQRRDPFGFLRYQLESDWVRPLEERSNELARSVLPEQSRAWQAARQTWWGLKRALL